MSLIEEWRTSNGSISAQDLIDLGGSVFYMEAATRIIDDPSLSFEEAWNRAWGKYADSSFTWYDPQVIQWVELTAREKEKFESTRGRLMEMREINLRKKEEAEAIRLSDNPFLRCTNGHRWRSEDGVKVGPDESTGGNVLSLCQKCRVPGDPVL